MIQGKHKKTKRRSQEINGSPKLFDQFWEAYPKHGSKGDEEKSFKVINPSEQLLARMISSIERARSSVEWRKQGRRYIPYPASWLRAKRWGDEFDGFDNGGKKGRKGFYLPGEYSNDLAEFRGDKPGTENMPEMQEKL